MRVITGTVDIRNKSMQGLDLSDSTIEGDLSIKDSYIPLGVNLFNTNIEGQLILLNCTTLTGFVIPQQMVDDGRVEIGDLIGEIRYI